MAKEPKKWSHSEGERPNTVTVAERSRGSPVYVKLWDPHGNGGEGRSVRPSLKFKVRDENGDLIDEAVEKAETYAREQALKLKKGRDELRGTTVTLARVFALYQRHVSPNKAEKTQREDARRVQMWSTVLGGGTDPHDVDRGQWDRWKAARRSGAIDSRGNRVPERKRRVVGDRTLESDGKWLHAVFNWAVTYKADGRYLMRENPIRGLVKHHLPKEKNPNRKAISQERHEAMLEAASKVRMEIRWHGTRDERESWLPELLILAEATGRRIGAIRQLRCGDVDLQRTSSHPFGALTWRAEANKQNIHTDDVPINGSAREALESILQKREDLGLDDTGPLFPRATDPEKPITTVRANIWFREAEGHVDRQEKGLDGPMPRNRTWHGYRAKWATETKHLPDKDRARVGGWSTEGGTETIRRIYDQSDPESTLRVVEDRRTLRETGDAQDELTPGI